jgi:hypothetical protein
MIIKTAPSRESDKQQMLAPNMGEIKQQRPERRKVTTMGVGRERKYATEWSEDWRK